MKKQSTFATDLEFVESLPECGKFTMKDWEKLKLELEKFIEIPDSNGVLMQPIQDLYAYFMDTTDISPKFATTCILFLLSSATRLDQVVVIRQGDTHLNIWFGTIGQSSTTRKTTVEHKIKRVLELAQIEMLPSKFTTAGLFLVMAHESQGVLIRGEFSGMLKDFVRDHYNDLPEVLCEVYDCEPEIKKWTKGNREESIENPYITLWTSTQPINYILFEEKLFSQGFLQRFLYCLEQEKYTWYDLSFDPQMHKTSLKNATVLLQAIQGTDITTIRPSTVTNSWKVYQNYCKKIQLQSHKDELSTLYPYYGRIPEFVLKVAGILEIARHSFLGWSPDEDGSIGLTDEALDLAVKMVRLFEQEFRTLTRKVRSIASSDPVKTEKDHRNHILNAIASSPGGVISMPELIIDTILSKNKLREVLESLLDSNQILWTFATRQPVGKRGAPPKLYWIASDDEMKEMNASNAIDNWTKNRE